MPKLTDDEIEKTISWTLGKGRLASRDVAAALRELQDLRAADRELRATVARLVRSITDALDASDSATDSHCVCTPCEILRDALTPQVCAVAEAERKERT